MSGLLALLDDVAGIAKIAAASVDDVIGQAAKAGSKAAGAVIDDAAVTPKYVQGFAPARELPIIWRIAKGSFKNKLLILLPAALLLSAFAPWAIMPLLMLGGGYLCFEGAEKVGPLIGLGHHHHEHAGHADAPPEDPAHLEEEKAEGAIKTDFILSAEIMTIALAALPEMGFWMEAATLAAVGIGITVIVYGGVALIVKADDLGLHMVERGRFGLTRALGAGIVKAMPGFLKALSVIGTAAMLWVGGQIVIHGLASLGLAGPEHFLKDLGHWAERVVAAAPGFAAWAVEAGLAGVFGLALGLVLIPIADRMILPLVARVTGKGGA